MLAAGDVAAALARHCAPAELAAAINNAFPPVSSSTPFIIFPGSNSPLDVIVSLLRERGEQHERQRRQVREEGADLQNKRISCKVTEQQLTQGLLQQQQQLPPQHQRSGSSKGTPAEWERAGRGPQEGKTN